MSGVGTVATITPGTPLEPLNGDAREIIDEPRDCCSRIFPFTLICCPCLPSGWTKIQDWLHLVLVVGVLGSIVCMAQMIYELSLGGACRTPLCFARWISGIAVIPSMIYFIKTIGQYDEHLRDKKKRHQEEVESLITNINEQVAEMNDLCRKVTENANEFAVGRFNDKCDQFRRFLSSTKAHYRDLYTSPDMLEELRSFVTTWFRTFSGTLINPETNPLMMGVEKELRKAKTPGDICDVALKRLSESKFAFQFQMPAETPLIAGASSASRRASAQLLEEGGMTAAGDIVSANKCGMSWLRCGKCRCCGVERTSTVHGMPVTVHFGCGSLKLLSRQHINLLCAFLVDLLLIAFEVWQGRWSSFTLIIVNECCVISLLACFEQINEIAQLERQIDQYKHRNEEVGKRRDEARANWEKVQQLHDLWLFRTLPCLSIMGKIHNHLADEDMARREAMSEGKVGDDPRPGFLRLANESLECLDRRLGTLDDWRKGGPLDEE